MNSLTDINDITENEEVRFVDEDELSIKIPFPNGSELILKIGDCITIDRFTTPSKTICKILKFGYKYYGDMEKYKITSFFYHMIKMVILIDAFHFMEVLRMMEIGKL